MRGTGIDYDGRYLPHQRSALREVKHLPRVEQPLELVQHLATLVAPALGVDKDEERFHVGRRDGLDDERLVIHALPFLHA